MASGEKKRQKKLVIIHATSAAVAVGSFLLFLLYYNSNIFSSTITGMSMFLVVDYLLLDILGELPNKRLNISPAIRFTISFLIGIAAIYAFVMVRIGEFKNSWFILIMLAFIASLTWAFCAQKKD